MYNNERFLFFILYFTQVSHHNMAQSADTKPHQGASRHGTCKRQLCAQLSLVPRMALQSTDQLSKTERFILLTGKTICKRRRQRSMISRQHFRHSGGRSDSHSLLNLSTLSPQFIVAQAFFDKIESLVCTSPPVSPRASSLAACRWIIAMQGERTVSCVPRLHLVKMCRHSSRY